MKARVTSRSFTAKAIYLAALILRPLTRAANRISWRFGRPYGCSARIPVGLPGRLLPGMVLLSHKKYELTNLFIPGYWTHAALVACSDEVLEAVSAGVTRRSLADFVSHADDVLVLRPAFCGPEEMRMAVRRAGQYLGLPYNFLFNPSEGSCYCSELVCRAYEGAWPATAGMRPGDSLFEDLRSGRILYPHRFAVTGEFLPMSVAHSA